MFWSTQSKAFIYSVKQEMIFWNSLAFSMIQWILAICALVPLLFLNPACTSGSSIHILLISTLKDFEHDLASIWNECSCAVAWTSFGIALLQNWNEKWPFPVLWPLLGFPNLLGHIDCSTLTPASFSILNSSSGIPSLPLSLLVVMFPKAHLISHSRMYGSRWVITPL